MDEKLYPLEYKGKLWNIEDVNDIFRTFYHSEYSLAVDMSVYVSEGMRITPDGEWTE